MDEFNAENARKFLERLREIEPEKPPVRQSIKQVIFELAPTIRELMAKGWSQKQILEKLKIEYDLKLEYGTFRNYLNQAAKESNGN